MCSGARRNPRYVLSFGGWDARSSRELYELSGVEDAPGVPKNIAWVSDYEEARGLFLDEYFGDASTLFLSAEKQLKRLQEEFEQAILERKELLEKARSSREFDAAIEATLRLESWKVGDFSATRASLKAMIRDEKLVKDSEFMFGAGDLGELARLLPNLKQMCS